MINIKYIAVFTKIPHWPLTQARRIHTPSDLISLRSILISSFKYTYVCHEAFHGQVSD